MRDNFELLAKIFLFFLILGSLIFTLALRSEGYYSYGGLGGIYGSTLYGGGSLYGLSGLGGYGLGGLGMYGLGGFGGYGLGSLYAVHNGKTSTERAQEEDTVSSLGRPAQVLPP